MTPHPSRFAAQPVPAGHPARSPGSRHAGFTLIELLVVISIIGILAGLLLPAIGIAMGQAQQTACASNQKQLMIACKAYANMSDGDWPSRPTVAAGTTIDANSFGTGAAGADPVATTIASFEWLVVATGDELTNSIFACKSSPNFKPTTLSGKTPMTFAGLTTNWGVEWAADKTKVPGFTYDWSAPVTSKSSRVITADRGRGQLGHKSVVMAAFADGHTTSLPKGSGNGTAGESVNNIDNTPDVTIYFNRENGQENVYDSKLANVGAAHADDLDTNAPGSVRVGRGSTTAAWVR